MADDSDVPPLEDMTEVLKQADVVRQARENVKQSGRAAAKEKAKVKKNITAKAVPPEQVTDVAGSGDHKLPTATDQPAKTGVSQTKVTSSPTSTTSASNTAPSTSATPSKASGGMFGGMKKGFLFGGGPSKAPTSNKTKSSGNTQNQDAKAAVPVKKETTAPKPEKEEIPYISPKTGKTESGLTLNEVQQAMSEAKGLLDNQDWINDELLDKVEKNELLLKRFSDPYFMKALEEFQTNPEGAMEKYKGNKEVEKFLTEFCGLLGDHFTKIGDTSSSSSGAKSASQLSKSVAGVSEKPATTSKTSKPSIVEISDDAKGPAAAGSKNSNKSTSEHRTPKIIEITDDESPAATGEPLKKLNTPDSATKLPKGAAQICTHSPLDKADIQEVQPQSMDDAEVKKMLEDPKVMDVLMDPKIVNLIQLLRSDPEKAHRLVEKADSDLRDKIRLLVSKGLLQIQTG